jgi:16S rRNA processing protein RimM
MEPYIEIGLIHKPHGLIGELKMTIQDDYLPFLLEKGYVLINTKGQMIPAFIEGIRGNNPMIVKLESLNRLEDVSNFTNSKIYMRKEDIKSDLKEAEKSSEWEGYSLVNLNDQQLMLILETREYPMQTMLVVNHNDEEKLIPLVQGWIEEIDNVNKKLIMKLPAGLY